MSARSLRQAVEEFLRPFRQAIACVTNAQLRAGYQPGRTEHALVFGADPGGIVSLAGRHRLALRLVLVYRVDEEADGWAVHTTGYAYVFSLVDGAEILAYHFDPRGTVSPVKTSHLHVRGLTSPLPLGKAHIPTSRVSIEVVLRFVITELGVEPRRDDWEEVLDQGEAQFNQKRTW